MQKIAFIIGFLLISVPLCSQECGDKANSSREILHRRKALLNILDTGSGVVIKSADATPDNMIEPFRQSPDFMYLTGIDDPGYKIIMYPKGYGFGNRLKSVIIFTYPDQLSEPVILSAGDTLLDDKFFEPVLGSITRNLKTLYYSPVPELSNDWLNGKVVIREREVKKNFEQAHPGVKLKPANKLFSLMRQIKTDDEIAQTRKAIGFTNDGIRSVMQKIRPGMYEYEAQAIIEYEAKSQGASSMSFPSIIGSGTNSLMPHYERNNCRMKKEDIVVMDVGARYESYCADITRTIPVSGSFTPGQQVIYQAVLDIQKEVIAMIKPGITFSDLDRRTTQLTAAAGYKNYIIHSVTHSLGLVVHDPSAGDTLSAGMIITIEPGIYIPADDTVQAPDHHGFGVRIEDDVLVTADGFEVLSKNIPKEIAEIEMLMKNKRK